MEITIPITFAPSDNFRQNITPKVKHMNEIKIAFLGVIIPIGIGLVGQLIKSISWSIASFKAFAPAVKKTTTNKEHKTIVGFCKLFNIAEAIITVLPAIITFKGRNSLIQ